MTSVKYRRTSGGFGTYPQSFSVAALAELAELLDSALRVCTLRDADTASGTVAIRHDVDHNLEHAVAFARWEQQRGYRASYFVLPDAWYAQEKTYEVLLGELVALGHEVGLHSNVCGIAYREGRLQPVDGSAMPAGFCERPAEIMHEQLAGLRDLGLDVVGTAAHGAGIAGIDNLDLWAAGYLPSDFGLQYEAYHLHREAHYVSDNRGKWQTPYEANAERIELATDQATHLLIHPCHWELT